MEIRLKSNKKVIRFTWSNIIKIIEFISSLLIISIFFLLVLQVISRYFLEYPFSWPEEVSGFLLSWTIFFGSIVAYDSGKLSKILFLREKLPISLQILLEITMNIIVILVLFILINKGLENTILSASRRTPALRFRYSYVTVALPIGFSLLVVGYIKNSIKSAYDLLHKSIK